MLVPPTMQNHLAYTKCGYSASKRDRFMTQAVIWAQSEFSRRTSWLGSLIAKQKIAFVDIEAGETLWAKVLPVSLQS